MIRRKYEDETACCHSLTAFLPVIYIIAMANVVAKLPTSFGPCLQRSYAHRCLSVHPLKSRLPARQPFRAMQTTVRAAGKAVTVIAA